jgi:hypothetical protein
LKEKDRSSEAVNDVVESVKFPTGPKDDFVDELVISSEPERKSKFFYGSDCHSVLSRYTKKSREI